MQNKSAMMNCGICQCTPTEMSKIENIDGEIFTPNPSSLLHGMTQLHARIQSFNFLKNIGFRKFCVYPKWKVDGKSEEKFKKRKEEIQKQFLKKLDLRVDFPNTKGGTSTTGNVCRKAFANHEITAEILNIDVRIVERFKKILYVISSKKFIRTKEFHAFCSETYRELLQKYPWVHVSPSVHKILAHSAQVAESLPLPLGMFGEEGSESRNKMYRNDREHHSRQTSRLASLTDVFNRAMDSSDPYINHIYSKPNKNKADSSIEIPPDMMENFLFENDEIQSFFEEEETLYEENE